MAIWVDEYHSVYPTMPASIEGLGLSGIVSEVGKKIIAAALLAERLRLEAVAAAKVAEENEMEERRLKDLASEHLAAQLQRSQALASKLFLEKRQKAKEFIGFQEKTKTHAWHAITKGILECRTRFGYKGADTEGKQTDHFDQGHMTLTEGLSTYISGKRELLPPPAILVLSLLTMPLDTSTPFVFKHEEWSWLSEAMDAVDAVIAVRIRSDHLAALMAVLSALKYYVDSVPYVIGQTQTFLAYNPQYQGEYESRTGLITGFMLTAAKDKKTLDKVLAHVVKSRLQVAESAVIARTKIFDQFEWLREDQDRAPGIFDAYTFRPDLYGGQFGSKSPEFLMLAHFLAHRYTTHTHFFLKKFSHVPTWRDICHWRISRQVGMCVTHLS